MTLDRVRAEAQLLGDFRIRQPLAGEAQDLALAQRQAGLGFSELAHAPPLAQQPLGEDPWQPVATLEQHADALEQVLAGGVAVEHPANHRVSFDQLLGLLGDDIHQRHRCVLVELVDQAGYLFGFAMAGVDQKQVGSAIVR
jgi:hypothetical protein